MKIETQNFNSQYIYKNSPIKSSQITFCNSERKFDEFAASLKSANDEEARAHILEEFNIYKEEEFEKSKNELAHINMQLQEIIATSFKPSEVYSPEVMNYAKKYLGNKNWEEELRKEHMHLLCTKMNGFKYVFTKAPEKETEQVIKKVRLAMVDLNNQKLRELQLSEKKTKARQKQLEIELKKKEAERNERLKKEQLNAKIKEKLTTHFLNPIKKNSEQTPTVIMLEGDTQNRRNEIKDWIKNEVDARVVCFNLPDDEDDALYRLNIELQYSQENYEKTGKRSALFIDNFSNLLNSSKASNETIAEMKALLFSLSEEKEPVTIIFDEYNSNNIDSAFLNNKRRIPLRLNLEDLTLGQRKDWNLHLDENMKNWDNQRLEIHKCYLSRLADNALREKNYRKVISLKETIAMICEMQGKERDGYLLRCDIDNYLKRI